MSSDPTAPDPASTTGSAADAAHNALEDARQRIVRAELTALAEAAGNGTLDDATLAAGLAAVRQVPLDPRALLDTPHVPVVAGVYRDALERILARIPTGWGRWIDCGPGWYPILADLDAGLGALIPAYEVHQVKEKYGTLRFYWGVPATALACCVELDRVDPRPIDGAVTGPLVPPGRLPADQAVLDAWWERRQAHLASDTHQRCFAERAATAARQRDAWRAVAAQADALVEAAEERSARTCEDCGAPAVLCEQGGWLRTVCATCAAPGGYQPVSLEP